MARGTAVKRIRQNEVRARRNRALRTELKTKLKGIAAAIESKDVAAAERLLRPVISSLGKAAAKKVIKKEHASRTVAHLSRKLHTLATSAPSAS